MATLKHLYSAQPLSKLALIVLSLLLISTVSVACSGSDEPDEQAVEPTTGSSAPVLPTATAVPPTATTSAPPPAEDPPAATAVPPAATTAPPAAAGADPTATPVPEVVEAVVEYFRVADKPSVLLAVGSELVIASETSGYVSIRTVPSGESAGSIRGGRDAVSDLAFDGENIWTSDLTDTAVKKLDLDGTVLGKFKVQSPSGIVFDGSSIWVSSKGPGTVTNLALDGTEIGVYDAGPFPEAIAFDGTDVWVTNAQDESVSRISQAGELLQTIDLGVGRDPYDIVADEKYVWVSNGFHFLTRIPVGDGSIRDFVVGRVESTGHLALDGDSVYVTHRQSEEFGSVTKLSQDGDWLSTVIVGGDNPAGVAVIDSVVYVGLDKGNQIAVASLEVIAAGAPTVLDGVIETEVTIVGTEATITGILARPTGPGPHPALLAVNGSGSDNRDGVFTWRQAREGFQYLAQQGIATLRLDDRGIGMSTGEVLDTTIASRVVDTIDAFEFLKVQDGIDPAKVGLLGYSEGAVVVAATAAEIEVAFVVSVGGPVAPIKDIYPVGRRLLLEAGGSAESYINQVLEDLAYAHNALLTGENLEELENQVALGSVIIIAPDYVQADPEELLTPWYTDLLKFDPGPKWAEVEEPILAIFGGKDWIVPTEQNEPLLREILANSGHTNYQIEIFLGTNHFFQPAETGAMEEIGINPREFIPGFLDLISTWITNQIDNG